MKFKVLIAVLILGLITTTNCQATNDTNGTTNGTTPAVASPEETLTALLDYSAILEASFSPQQVAENLLLQLDGISNLTSNLNHLAMIMASKNKSENVDLATLSGIWNNFSANEEAIFSFADSWLLNIETSLDKVECYNKYRQADVSAYTGISTLVNSFFSNESANSSSGMLLDQQSNMSYYCDNIYNASIQQWDDFFSVLLGEDKECDLIMDIYNGSQPLRIWAGWRNFVADIFGYLFLDVWFIQMTSTACQTLNGVADADISVTQLYQERVQQLIQRFQEIDNKSLSEVNETLSKNVQSFISSSAGQTPFVAAIQMSYSVLSVYPQYDPLIFVFDANASSDQYAIQCDQCVKVFGEEGLSAVVAYVDKNTNSSLDNVTLDSMGENSTSAQDVVGSIFSANDCTSGVIAMNKDVDQYLLQYLGDRFEVLNTTDLNVYVWGVQEGCAGGNATNPGNNTNTNSTNGAL